MLIFFKSAQMEFLNVFELPPRRICYFCHRADATRGNNAGHGKFPTGSGSCDANRNARNAGQFSWC